MKKKTPPVGSVFLVPLRDCGFAVGLMARTNGRGFCFGYFFVPRVHSEKEVDFANLRVEDAVWIGKFGDLDLVKGNWKILGKIDHFHQDEWPLPAFIRVDEKANRAWLSKYDEKLRFISEKEVDPDQVENYPYDGLMGSGAVEIRLTKLLK